MRLPFHRGLKRLLIEAFSSREVSPQVLTQKMLRLAQRPCTHQDGEAFRHWLASRGVQHLVHFTQLANVPTIIRFGLIPREYLELELVQLALGGQFSDDIRQDGMPQFNCLSITSPNYAMFYRKRQHIDGNWAVIEFDAAVLSRLYFVFTPTNAAAVGVTPSPGVEGAEQLFALPAVRNHLKLKPCEPTDPQAESLCDSVLAPDHIRGVYVDRRDAAQWLADKGITAQINPAYFGPRRDHEFWRGRRITDLMSAEFSAAQGKTGDARGTTPRIRS